MLNEIRSYGFAMKELNLYLDTLLILNVKEESNQRLDTFLLSLVDFSIPFCFIFEFELHPAKTIVTSAKHTNKITTFFLVFIIPPY